MNDCARRNYVSSGVRDVGLCAAVSDVRAGLSAQQIDHHRSLSFDHVCRINSRIFVKHSGGAG